MKRPESAEKHPLVAGLEYFRDLGFKDLYLDPPEKKAAVPAKARPATRPPSPPATARPATVSTPPVRERPPVAKAKLSPEEKTAALCEMAQTVSACEKCKLCETRNKTVFSDGNPITRLMFIGEAPGENEDAQGIPFVGRAGQLLTRMIENGMGLARADVYIANVLKCRPPENRDPLPAEIAQCRGYLEAQIELVRPEVIVALGKFAAQFLLETEEGIMRLRGRWGSYKGIPVMPTYHPSFLLHSPNRKKEAWQDLILVLRRLGLPVPAPGKQ